MTNSWVRGSRMRVIFEAQESHSQKHSISREVLSLWFLLSTATERSWSDFTSNSESFPSCKYRKTAKQSGLADFEITVNYRQKSVRSDRVLCRAFLGSRRLAEIELKASIIVSPSVSLLRAGSSRPSPPFSRELTAVMMTATASHETVSILVRVRPAFYGHSLSYENRCPSARSPARLHPEPTTRKSQNPPAIPHRQTRAESYPSTAAPYPPSLPPNVTLLFKRLYLSLNVLFYNLQHRNYAPGAMAFADTVMGRTTSSCLVSRVNSFSSFCWYKNSCPVKRPG